MKPFKQVIWECMNDRNWTDYPTDADDGDDIIEALREAGYAIIQREPTDAWRQLATGPMSGNELCDNINIEGADRVYHAVVFGTLPDRG